MTLSVFPKYIHLRCHTEYSIRDGLLRIKPWLEQVAKLQMPAVAMTDHHNLFGLIKFYRHALSLGIKPIIGADFSLAGESETFNMTLLCQNHQGYQNLLQLLSRAYIQGQNAEGQPRLQTQWLEEHQEGLLVLSGGRAGDVGQALLAEQWELAKQRLQKWLQIFPQRFYLELQRTGRPQEETYINAALSIAAEHSTPVVATNEVCFLQRDDFLAHEARTCIHAGRILADPLRAKNYTEQQYLRTAEEMADLFADIPEALANSVAIAQRCNVKLSLGEVHLPKFPLPDESIPVADYFAHEARQGLQGRLQNSTAAGVPAEGNSPYAMGDRKGERAERLPLHSEHRLCRAQDINRKQFSLYSAGIAGTAAGVPAEGNSPYAMGDRKGERAERLPLHSEHRLCRAQDIDRKQFSLYSAGIAGTAAGVPAEGNSPYAMGDRKGERAERLPLHSEHRLCRAQDIDRKQFSLYSAGIAGAAVSLPVYEERLQQELSVINRMGFAGYFLIVADFIRWAKEQDIPVGPGRGSGAGSLVAYALGITELDPLQHELLFERFLNPERVSMPDFDIDFCMEGRDRVIEYVSQRYGREAVSQIITFGTMAAKAVVRDVGRVLGMPYGFVDKIAKLIPFELGMTLEKALTEEEQLAQRYRQEEEVASLIDLARKLEGITRNAGKHAGGVVIAPTRLVDFTPLYCEPGGEHAVTQFDKDDVESAGLVKFDFLGLRTLTIIHWALKAINKKQWRCFGRYYANSSR